MSPEIVEIVLDKSYLEAKSAPTIQTLCREHTVLFIEPLLFELLTTTEDQRRKCFAKFPQVENPVLLIPRPGPLFQYEIRLRKPATPLSAHRIDIPFKFNPHLSSRGFKMLDNQAEALTEWNREIEKEIEAFHDLAVSVTTWCPGITSLVGQELAEKCQILKEEAASNHAVVLGIYNTLGVQGFPASTDLNSSWMIFRYLQAYILFYLDYISRNGMQKSRTSPRRIEHEIHDIHYAMYGAQAGALASRDKRLIANFRLMAPDGVLIS